MAAIDDLRTALTTKINAIDDDIVKNTALLLLEDMFDAYTAWRNSLSQDNITAYSVTGRSFSFGGSEDLHNRYLVIRNELRECIQGDVDLVAMDEHEDNSI